MPSNRQRAGRRPARPRRSTPAAGTRAGPEATSHLRTVLAHAPIVLFTLDERGVFTLQEGRGLEAARLHPQEEIGQSIFRLYQDYPWVTDSARRALAGESVRVVGEFQGVWYEVDFMPLRLPETKSAGVLGVATDVTARKRAQDALEQQQAVLKYVIANVPHAIFWKDREGRFLGGNQNFLNDTGTKTLENLVGKTDYDVWGRREDADAFVKADREVMVGGASMLDIEEPVLRTDGARRVLLTSKVPIRDESGQVTGLLGIYADITERKQMEIDLQHAKEAADDAARAKGQFLTVMSHELRTPLALILGPLASLLSGEANERAPLSPGARADLERIQRNARRLHRLVDDILDYQKIEAGKLTVDWEAVDAAELCAELVDAARPSAVRGGITLSLRASVLGPVPLDRRKFERIVLNLLGNALKFTPPGGSVVVHLRKVEDALEFAVEDTGPGIPADKQHLLFRQFQQIDASATRKHEGTGIGLSLVKELAELMGGEASVESTLGVGSRFFVRLPCVADRMADPRPAPAPASAPLSAPRAGHFEARAASARRVETSGRGPRVLVVEDNPDMGSYLVDLLSAEYDVELVTNGRAALGAVEARRPEVIVSDVMMPEMDGFELVRRLKRDPASRAIPILLLTARAGSAAAVGGLDTGADDYLSKPFEPAELAARVRAAARLHRAHVELAEKNRALTATLQRLSETQEELVQAGKMAAVGTMLAGLSHEINNPLAVVLMNAQLLLRRLDAAKGAALDEVGLRKALHTIESQSTRCSRLVHTLLDYAREHPTGREPCDVRAALDRVLAFTAPQARAREVRLDVWQDPEAPQAVLANAAQLDAALLNVVGNALDAVSEGGAVSVVARSLDKGEDAAPAVEIEVRDTGCGIPAENLDRIFEPFFTTKPPGQGTGLGLTLTQRFVADHGGRLCVTSQLGVGTTVRMSLPAALG
ncbi:ATP-binding protein [Polyangium sorediatum]|uniref:histidine kinase n=1 Tax=Polyangium sorediatum TaxID=889274 RepID=A0ABT6NY43_9BACT|nr:ATP-binding protein [Polyangium sorediatum]MDI1432995.1 ATP-binding protein [Polyangium sorediatum]